MSVGLGCNRRLAYSTKVRLFLSAFVFLFFLILVKDSIVYDWYAPRAPLDTDRALHWDGVRIAKGNPRWQPADKLDQVFVFSAHYDDIGSSPLIRVIGIALDPLPYFFVRCRYFGRTGGDSVYTVSGDVLHMRGRNGRRYLGAFLECPLNKSINFLPYALTVDRGNNSESLNYIIVNYSRDVILPSPTEPTPSSEDEYENYTDEDDDATTERQTSLSESDVSATTQDWQWNVTRCFPAFQMGFDDHVMLAEMVAVSRLLGVQHFVFYVQSAGPQVLRMLEVLEAQGDTDVIPWNMNLADSDLYYAGQLASVNDCLYRHLWSSRFLLFGDVDEVFVPRAHPSLLLLLEQSFMQNPDCGAFLFLNVFFNLRFPPAKLPRGKNSNNNNNNKATLTHIRRLKILTHTRRHSEVLPPAVRSKPALDPRKVLTGSVHVIETFRDGYESCVMSPRAGLLHHYRDYDEPPEDQQENDAYLWQIYDDIVAESRMILDEYDAMID